MPCEIWQQDRPKGRKPVWAFRLIDGATESFTSQCISVRLLTRDAAAWVAGLVEAQRGSTLLLPWTGDFDDDCSVTWKRLYAHAEHMEGPRRGGIWFCSVSDLDGKRLFHTADNADVQPKSGSAARWLCELIISSADSGILDPYT